MKKTRIGAILLAVMLVLMICSTGFAENGTGYTDVTAASEAETDISESAEAKESEKTEGNLTETIKAITAEIRAQAEEFLNRNQKKAEELLQDPNKVETVLQLLEKKLKEIPIIGDELADVPAVISMIRSSVRKEYRDVPIASVVAGLAAAIYVISPTDIISDRIPVIGKLDDAVVLKVCHEIIHTDLEKYKAWRKQPENHENNANE